MTNRLHIVFVSRELGIYKNTGGIGTYVWDLARKITKYGHKCTVICSSYDPLKEDDIIMDGVRIIKLPDVLLLNKNRWQTRMNFKTNFLFYRRQVSDSLDKVIDTEKIDLVEFAEFGVESLFWQKKPRRVPMIIRWHTPIGRELKVRDLIYYPINRWTKSLIKESLYSADAITFPSLWMMDKVKKEINLDKCHYITIPNGINYEEWQSADGTKLKADNSSPFNIVFAGTLGARKGFNDLIKAVKLLRRNNMKVNLILIGKHSSYGRLIIRKEQHNINKGWLRIKGAVPRNDLVNYFSYADICCFPSWFDTVGLVCLEAMACGGIVIGSRNSGMAEVIRDGVDGFIVEPKNPKILAECLKKVIGLSDAKKLEIKNQAKKRILEYYDNSIILKQLIDFYKQVAVKWENKRWRSL